MTSREIHKKVKAFKKKFGLTDCTYSSLREATENQGYTIVEYNSFSNDDSVQTVIDSLGVLEYVTNSKGFTYVDKNYRIVFIHDALSDEEKLKILAHENGHIFLEHFASAQVIGRDVQEEYEANEFSHYLLTSDFLTVVCNGFAKHKKVYLSILAIILVLAVIGAVFGFVKNEEQYHDEYLITATGDKYHREDCIFVKNKNNTERLKLEQFESGEYKPCAVCLPD